MSDRAGTTVLMLAARVRLAGKATYGPQVVAARFQLLGRTIDSQPARLDADSMSPLDGRGYELCSSTGHEPVGVLRLTLDTAEPALYADGRLTHKQGAEMARVLRDDEAGAWLLVLRFAGTLDLERAGAVLRDARFRTCSFERNPSWKRATTLAMRSSIRVEGQP